MPRLAPLYRSEKCPRTPRMSGEWRVASGERKGGDVDRAKALNESPPRSFFLPSPPEGPEGEGPGVRGRAAQGTERDRVGVSSNVRRVLPASGPFPPSSLA